ncbi:glycosyltransferase family 4 protein [Cupriavidus necator]|uniref:glycosyltransferase family 4 protein n=1 Tax=Cupriavidus necator TaxID=106590 RepID=UPI001E3F7853|nr:glycosyltransferase family 4 protein [Cupriavidus necator]
MRTEKIQQPSQETMRPMKVLHLINGEFYSGAERVQDLLALRLPEFGVECGFACLKPELFPSCRRSVDTPLHKVSMRSRFDTSVAGQVADLIRQHGYRLLHTHTPRAALIGKFAASKAGIPMVHHVHSPTRRDSENRARTFINAIVENWSLSKAARLIAVSNSLSQYLRDCGFSSNQIAVVPNGVPAIGDQSIPNGKSSEWVIGTVALFRQRKGLEVLLQALALLREKGQSVRLLAVGAFETAQYEKHIREVTAKLNLDDAITWAGFTLDVATEFKKMDVFVLPSLFGEGLPMVVIEAMALGLPVVATRVEGIPEVLEPDGAGIIVEPNQPRAMAEAIEKLIQSPAQLAQLAECGRARQRSHYSDIAMAREVATIYREIVE